MHPGSSVGSKVHPPRTPSIISQVCPRFAHATPVSLRRPCRAHTRHSWATSYSSLVENPIWCFVGLNEERGAAFAYRCRHSFHLVYGSKRQTKGWISYSRHGYRVVPILGRSLQRPEEGHQVVHRTSSRYAFWIYPDGKLHDAKDAHCRHVPIGFEHILNDEPGYGGFLRERVASNCGRLLIVVYCRPEALIDNATNIERFLDGVSQLPAPIEAGVLIDG